MKLKLILIALLYTTVSFSQSEGDLRNISQIDSLISAHIDLNRNDYLSYSVNGSVVVVGKNKCVYYLSLKDGLVQKKKLQDLSVDTLFDVSNLKTGKRFSNSDYNNSCISSYVYLSLTTRGMKVFHFNLPFMLLCGHQRVDYPFRYEILGMLHKLLSTEFSAERK